MDPWANFGAQTSTPGQQAFGAGNANAFGTAGVDMFSSVGSLPALNMPMDFSSMPQNFSFTTGQADPFSSSPFPVPNLSDQGQLALDATQPTGATSNVFGGQDLFGGFGTGSNLQSAISLQPGSVDAAGVAPTNFGTFGGAGMPSLMPEGLGNRAPSHDSLLLSAPSQKGVQSSDPFSSSTVFGGAQSSSMPSFFPGSGAQIASPSLSGAAPPKITSPALAPLSSGLPHSTAGDHQHHGAGSMSVPSTFGGTEPFPTLGLATPVPTKAVSPVLGAQIAQAPKTTEVPHSTHTSVTATPMMSQDQGFFGGASADPFGAAFPKLSPTSQTPAPAKTVSPLLQPTSAFSAAAFSAPTPQGHASTEPTTLGAASSTSLGSDLFGSKDPFGTDPFGSSPFGGAGAAAPAPSQPHSAAASGTTTAGFGADPFGGADPFAGSSLSAPAPTATSTKPTEVHPPTVAATSGVHGGFGSDPFGKDPFGSDPFDGSDPFGGSAAPAVAASATAVATSAAAATTSAAVSTSTAAVDDSKRKAEKAEAEKLRAQAEAEQARAEAAKKEEEAKKRQEEEVKAAAARAAEEKKAADQARKQEEEAKSAAEASKPKEAGKPAGGVSKPLGLPQLLDPVEVARGKHPDSVMWRKLQGLSALTPAAALHRLGGGFVSEGNTSSGRMSDPALDLTSMEALRTSEEGSQDRLIACRSLAKKRVVLDCAVHMANRDAILLVLAWMRDTLKKDLFFEEVAQRPKAVLVYATYLAEMHRWDELETFYTTVRQYELLLAKSRGLYIVSDTCEQLGLGMIRRALTKGAPDEMCAVLKEACDFATALAPTFPELERLAEHCSTWRQLVQRQVDIERLDVPLAAHAEALGAEKIDANNLWARFPRSCMLAASVHETVDYCALYHAGERIDHVASPKGLCKALNVSDKLYWHCAFTALARTGSWNYLRQATEVKSTFSGKVVDKSPIGFRPLICLIYAYGDPRDLKDPRDELRKLAVHFAYQMEDREDALKLCVQKKLWEGAIAACVDLRDEDRLVELRVTIANSPGDNERFLEMIDSVYKDSRIKWKSDMQNAAGNGPLRKIAQFLGSEGGGLPDLLRRGMSKIGLVKGRIEIKEPVREITAVKANTQEVLTFGAGSVGFIGEED